MFDQLLHPPRRTLLDRALPLLVSLALLFVVIAIPAIAAGFAASAPAPDARATTTGPIQCTTADGTVVLVGELRVAQH